MADKIATRESYGKALVEFADKYDYVVLDADLAEATKTVTFKKACPDRFFDCGIAEGNMVTVAAGLAAAGKMAFASSFAMFAAHYKLDNLCVIVDYNKLQIDGPVADIIGPAPFEPKFEAFGFNVITIDGHNIEEIDAAMKNAKETKGKPTAIIANTVKGKGVSFMENKVNWHGSAPNDEQCAQAVAEIEARI